MKDAIRSLTILLLGAVVLFTVPSLSGQSTESTVLGTVHDSSSTVVSGAAVTLTNQGTNEQRAGTTDVAGDYRFAALPAGVYRVSVKASGFKLFVAKDITLDSSRIRRVDATLELGDVTTTVTVEGGNVAAIETESATLSGVKTATEFANLPFSALGRGWNNLAAATAGVASQSGFETNGGADTANNFTADGVSVNDVVSSRQTANGFGGDIETFSEFKVITTNASAEYAQMGQYIAVSKTGTNMYHGTAFWANYNSFSQARKWTDRSAPAFTNYNQFMGNFGGPVVIPHLYNGKNKTFYFVTYGGARLPQGARTYLNVPTQAFRNGDFSSLLPSIVITDPTTGQAFANNQIPANRMSSVATALQKLAFPLPNLPGQDSLGLTNNYVGDPGALYQADNLSVRVDHKLSDSNNVFARVTATINNADTNPGALLGGFGGTAANNTSRTGVLSDTHVFGPSLVNVAKIAFNRSYVWTHDWNSSDVISQIGLQGISNPSQQAALSAMPDFEIGGNNGMAGTGVWSGASSTAQNTYQFTDDISWALGRHFLKAGVDVDSFQVNNSSMPQSVRGSFGFDDRLSGFAYANFLLGLPSNVSQAIPGPNAYMRSTRQGYYIQDEFKVSPRLTLNFGVRYEYQSPWNDKYNHLFSFDPTSGSMVVPGSKLPTDMVPSVASALPIIPASQTNGRFPTGNSLMFPDKNLWNPRAGLAWRPFSDSKTVVRAGYGMFSQMWPGGLGLNASSTASGSPWQSTRTWDIVDNTPLMSFPNPFTASGAGYAGVYFISAVAPRLAPLREQQWNISIGREFLQTAIDVAYVGTHGQNLMFSQNLDLPLPSTQPYNPSLVPYPQFNPATLIQSGASSIYNGLVVKADRKVTRGLSLNMNYTWAKALTDGDLRGPIFNSSGSNQWNRRLERADDSNIRRQVLTVVYIYELPFGKGKYLLNNPPWLVDKLVSGWQVSGITTFLTGPRTSVSYSGVDAANTNQWSGRPDAIGDGTVAGSVRNLIENHSPIFNKAAFLKPAQGRGYYGNSARNILTNPGTMSWNMTAAKGFYLFSDRARFQLRGEFFNAFNHPNFNGPNTNITSSSFGLVTSVGNARTIQLTGRFDF
jgi:hypothetical protein